MHKRDFGTEVPFVNHTHSEGKKPLPYAMFSSPLNVMYMPPPGTPGRTLPEQHAGKNKKAGNLFQQGPAFFYFPIGLCPAHLSYSAAGNDGAVHQFRHVRHELLHAGVRFGGILYNTTITYVRPSGRRTNPASAMAVSRPCASRSDVPVLWPKAAPVPSSGRASRFCPV